MAKSAGLHIAVGIDAKGGNVAVEGWAEASTLGVIELAGKFEDAGVSAIIYTDIERDGMESGPNLQSTEAFARSVQVPVIASGGISGIEDVRKIAGLSEAGVMGMITGRALYEGNLDLKEALRIAKGEK